MEFFKISCPFCGKEFTSDIEQRAKNDLEIHRQDKHPGRTMARTMKMPDDDLMKL